MLRRVVSAAAIAPPPPLEVKPTPHTVSSPIPPCRIFLGAVRCLPSPPFTRARSRNTCFLSRTAITPKASSPPGHASSRATCSLFTSFKSWLPWVMRRRDGRSGGCYSLSGAQGTRVVLRAVRTLSSSSMWLRRRLGCWSGVGCDDTCIRFARRGARQEGVGGISLYVWTFLGRLMFVLLVECLHVRGESDV